MTAAAPTIAVVDYGMGNLRSVSRAFAHVGHEVVVTADPDVVRRAGRVVVPGVGAFRDCVAQLRATGLADALAEVRDAGRPYLGICLGLQALFDGSEEFGNHVGLGWVPGRVVRFQAGGEKVPHMGWNAVRPERGHAVFQGLGDAPHMYFVHSFHAVPDLPDAVLATCDYGQRFVAAVARDNVVAVQFHPEKSQRAGLRLLANFAAWS